MSLKQMFLIGVVGPTVMTVLIFIAFLVCWFKFNWKEKFFEKFMKPQPANRGRISDHKMEPNILYRNHMPDLEDAAEPHHHHHQHHQCQHHQQQHIRIHTTPPSESVEVQSNMYEPVEVNRPGNHSIGQYLPVWTNNTSDNVSNTDDSSGYMSPASRSSSDLNDLSMDTIAPHVELANHSYCMNAHVDVSENMKKSSDCIYSVDCISCSQDSLGLDNSTCTESSVSASEGVQYGHVVTVIPDSDFIISDSMYSPKKSKSYTEPGCPDIVIVKDSHVKSKDNTAKKIIKDRTNTSTCILQYAHDTKYICKDYSDFTKVQLVPDGQVIKGFNV